jgi:hypothetical protein
MFNHEMTRKQFLYLAAVAAALPAASSIARAQIYPSRPTDFLQPPQSVR